MSSIRNAVKRVEHKERSQPAERRKRFGLLEKHKDYVLRAKDFHRKEATIKNLKEKASFRNPDEFYFKMEKTGTKDGVHQARVQDPSKYTHDELVLMKTQDIRYVINKAQSEAKKVERLQASLHSIGETSENVHVRFTTREEADEEATGLGEEDEDEHVAMMDDKSGEPARRGSRKRKLDEVKEDVPELPKSIERRRKSAYRELEERKERAHKLAKIAQKMALEKELMGKGRVRKIRPDEDTNPNGSSVYKWRKERKK
eukprot:TRINITY_DN24038_c0_g1_i1.p1 TRINITY_DN24038_c0_g1~~TRINITY_DN24038_c0_g1_i1.p1  ORF type:complete len:258 (-),score=57.16 TRINITY_DN24038_c0_g1_i1:187-960(-)